jgi:hypothetical protein
MSQRLSRVSPGDTLLLDEPGSDVVEIPLLLQGWQMTALETAAHNRGQTAGEMVRDLLRDFLARLPEPTSDKSQRRF